MRIAVFGATGGTGRHLVRQALETGHEVRALVRDPARLPTPRPAGLEVVTVTDMTDPAALSPHLGDRDAVLSALGTTTRTAGFVAPAVRAVLTTMAVNHVRRLLVVSAAPVGPVPEGESLAYRALLHPLVSRVFRNIYADLGEMERLVGASASDWTVVRPPRLLDRPGTGRYRADPAGNVRGGRSIARADLAHAMLRMLTDPATVKQTIGVAD